MSGDFYTLVETAVYGIIDMAPPIEDDRDVERRGAFYRAVAEKLNLLAAAYGHPWSAVLEDE